MAQREHPPTILRRTATISRRWQRDDAPDEEQPPVYEIALSSEEPVARWFGIEILLHTPEAVDLGRAEDGLPLLVNHDPDQQAGRLRDVRLDDDGRIRARMQFSRSAFGQEIAADVEDGIRVEASIGYQVEQWEIEEKQGQAPVYRATRWRLLEGSLVGIPADATVGVGRSAPEAAPARIKSLETEVRMAQDTTPQPSLEDVRKAEATRVNDLVAFATQYQLQERLSDWIAQGATLAQAKAEAFERQSRQPAAVPVGPELTEREFKRFSVVRAIQAIEQGRRDGFEFEVSDEIAKAVGKPVNERSFFVPPQVQAAGHVMTATRANELTVATGGVGGYLKFTEYAGFIDLLREKLVTLQMGVQYIPGLTGDFQWVRKSAGSTGGWQSTELTNQANSAWTLVQITLQPKIYQNAMIVSRKLLAQSAEAVEPLVRNELAQNHAVAIERAILAGTGTSGQPTGISATPNIGSVVGGTNGLQPTSAQIWELYSDVATANADTGSLGFITHPLGIARLGQTPAFIGATAWVLLQPAAAGSGALANGAFSMLGLPTAGTTAVPSGQTKGTSTDCYYIYFGDWSQAVLGEWGATEIVVDPLTLAPSQVKLSSIQMVDVGVLQPGAFSVMQDARP